MEDNSKKDSVREIMIAAEKGDGKARLELAKYYFNGYCVAKDKKAGCEWLLKAAEENNEAEAYYYLGYNCEHGEGVEVDLKKSVEYHKKGAELGNVYSQLYLGYSYLTGNLNLNVDYKKAVKYFSAAAEQKNGQAFYYLARCYGDAMGVKKDYKKALDLMTNASKYGCSFQDTNVFVSFYAQQVNKMEAAGKAAKSKKKVVINAKDSKEKLFEKGMSVFTAGKYEDAVEYFAAAKEKGHESANYYLGNSYYFIANQYQSNESDENRYKKAIEYYKKSGELGFASAFIPLALIYEMGTGVKKNYKQAFKYYDLAASLFPVAKSRLGIFYYKGLGVERDYAKAVKLLEESLDANKTYEVLSALVDCYKNGLGVDKDLDKAMKYNAELEGANGNEDDEENKEDEELENEDMDNEEIDDDMEDDGTDDDVQGNEEDEEDFEELEDDEEDDEDVDPIGDFNNKLLSCEIDDEKVSKVEEFYGITAPDMLKRVITLCNSDTDNYLENNISVNILRFLSTHEILNPTKKYGIDYKSIGYVPIADCLNCDFIFYNSRKKIWVWCDGDNVDKIYVEDKNLIKVIRCLDDCC